MALPQPQQNKNYLPACLLAACLSIAVQSCNSGSKIYKSSCNDGISFKHVTFHHLMDSIDAYDQQYVEVSGRYVEDKELSALYNDSLFSDRSDKNGLWVNFSQDCPLYLTGTHQGLFEYDGSGFTVISNRSITIRGRIDLHNKGSHNRCKASIDRISFVKL
jgi:hypothetical protein